MKTLNAQVIWFNQLKGFGQVKASTGEVLFLHWKAFNFEGFKGTKSGQRLVVETKDNKNVWSATKEPKQ